MKEVTEVTNCPITNDSERFTYIDLGEMPLVNNLSDTREDSFNSPKYKLAVQYFKKSKLSCLTENVDPNLMFSQYSYKSGVVKAYADHCKEMFWFVDTYLNLKENDNLLDIGGNDGTLLHSFLEKKSYLNVLNVDASTNLTKLSRERGVPAINAFWGVETAKNIDKKFKLITSTNVFQHTPPIADFAEAISMSLDEKGIWCLEFPYWKTNMQTLQFDQIYHEHVYFYLVEPLKQLFDKFGLEIIKAVKYPIHGGTLRLLISKKGDWDVCDGVQKLIDEEQTINEQYYKDWGEVIEEHISDCKIMLQACKNQNNNIIGFGAAAKGCIFLNSAKIDHTILDVVIDDTDLKQDKFIPGTGIQIKSREYLKNNKVDYILILAHNFKDVIIESLRNDGYTGNFIILFPTIKTI
jgi:2-polyprenyl-3-methyl-5-hydroxy-6-metoxy-1,4-benzoquinol methylase